MTPEEKARVIIDGWLEDAGWKVIDRKEFSPDLQAVAVREGLMKANKEADYLLFIMGKAVGILEAKREEDDLGDEVSAQAEKYAHILPCWCDYFQNPLPLVYLSNGKKILFRDLREDEDYVVLRQMHTPKQMAKMIGITDFYAGLPTLKKRGLRTCQYEAITELEKSFRGGQSRALMVLATGAGKTYTACTAAYRFLEYTPMRKVLFLVDRNNLGKQAEGEFAKYCLTETGDPFNTIFDVHRLRSNTIPTESNVVISTIQRLYSLLTGTELEDSDDDESNIDENPLISLHNAKLPQDYFDLIIIDECHRSIYNQNSWGQVLNYFSTAKMIGLTATPTPETLAFFNNNRVINYTLEKSIIDGVNVDYRIFRIKTKTTEEGGIIHKNEQYKEKANYTGICQNIKSDKETQYSEKELNRSVINEEEIRLVLETFKNCVYPDMFPEREPNMDYLPKTLIFALNDAHADNIVRIAKEVFGRNDNKFVQKITYSAGDSNALIRSFRNDKDFRIAVTVTLVSTGTDIKPLEVVMFMRDVASSTLYTQMKGRGCRTIGDDILRNVTPNAISKDLFYLIDAVGVTETEKHVPKPTGEGGGHYISLEQLLEQISHGFIPDEHLRILASALSRIHNKSEAKHRIRFTELSGLGMDELAGLIYDAMESYETILPPFIDIHQPNLERKALVRPLATNPKARNYLLELNAGFVKILQSGEDTLIEAGFTQEEAHSSTAAFEKYVLEHCDEIEALRIIYNNNAENLNYQMLKELETTLVRENIKFRPSALWNAYRLIQPSNVVKLTKKEEREMLTNIIQLVRFAFHQITKLQTLSSTTAQYFNLWCGQAQRPMTDEQKSIMRTVANYISANGTPTIAEIREAESPTLAAQIISAYGDVTAANEAILSLSQFIIYAHNAA